MYEVKTPYFPTRGLQVVESPTKMICTQDKIPYDEPLAGRVFVKVDLLESVCSSFGENCMEHRQSVLDLISEFYGQDVSRGILKSFYRRFVIVRTLTNTLFEYYDVPNGDVYSALSSVLIRNLQGYENDVMEMVNRIGGKHLVTVNGYVYFSMPTIDNVPKSKGIHVIC